MLLRAGVVAKSSTTRPVCWRQPWIIGGESLDRVTIRQAVTCQSVLHAIFYLQNACKLPYMSLLHILYCEYELLYLLPFSQRTCHRQVILLKRRVGAQPHLCTLCALPEDCSTVPTRFRFILYPTVSTCVLVPVSVVCLYYSTIFSISNVSAIKRFCDLVFVNCD